MSHEMTALECQYWGTMQCTADMQECNEDKRGTYDSEHAEQLKENANDAARQQLASNLNAVLSKDGNQFCWLIGDNLQEGIAGFGDTVALALDDLYEQFHNFSVKDK